VEGQIPFLWGSSRQLSQLWFVNWSSNIALITPRCLYSNNWPVMCTMKHWISTNNILRGFWHHPDPQFSLCHNHRHPLSSCIISFHCTSWDYAQ
jgi:hypothetical protein